MNVKTDSSRGLWALSVVAVIVAALAVGKSLELRKVNRELQAENERLSARNEATVVRVVENGEGERLGQTEKLELMRLRNEVTQLRASAQAARDAVKAALENRLPREERVQTRTGSNQTEAGVISREELSLRGYATPEDAFVTSLWAMTEGQAETLKEALTPEGRRLFELRMAGKTEEEVAGMLQKQMEQLKTVLIKEQRQVSPTEMAINLQTGDENSPVHAVTMQLVGNEWKAVAPFTFEYDPLAFYRRNPELMRRYFPHLVNQDVQQQQGQVAPAGGSLPPEPAPK